VRTNGGAENECLKCVLSCTTGANISDSGGTSWTFSSTGSTFKIVGAFDLNGNGILDAGDIAPGTTLLTGQFNTPITVTTPNLLRPDLLFSASTIINTLNGQLTNFYGIPAGYTWNGTYSQTIDSFNRTEFTAGSNEY